MTDILFGLTIAAALVTLALSILLADEVLYRICWVSSRIRDTIGRLWVGLRGTG